MNVCLTNNWLRVYDFYDELVNQVDIYTEKELAKLTEDSASTIDYLNRIRISQIEQIKTFQNAHLKQLNLMWNGCVEDENAPSDEESLFSNEFCFKLNISPRFNLKYNLFIVFIDFYLNPTYVDILQ